MNPFSVSISSFYRLLLLSQVSNRILESLGGCSGNALVVDASQLLASFLTINHPQKLVNVSKGIVIKDILERSVSMPD